MTPAQGRAQRRALMREIAREERKRQRTQVAELKGQMGLQSPLIHD